MPLTRAALAPRVSVSPLSPTGPVPRLTDRIIELLRVEKGELVVDLYCSDLQSPQTVPEEIRRRVRMSALGPFSERLTFLLITSGVRMVQMGALTFGRIPMRYERVVLHDGFSQLDGDLRRLLADVLGRLDPAGRILVVGSAPSPRREHSTVSTCAENPASLICRAISLRRGLLRVGGVAGMAHPRVLPRRGAAARGYASSAPAIAHSTWLNSHRASISCSGRSRGCLR